jgi:hypothetical protein
MLSTAALRALESRSSRSDISTVTGELLSQLHKSSLNEGLGCCEGTPHRRGHLFNGEIGVVTKDQRRSMSFRDPADSHEEVVELGLQCGRHRVGPVPTLNRKAPKSAS